MKESSIRVLQVIKIMNHGGAETMIMNMYRNIDRNNVQFDFLCMEERIGEYEEEILKLGGKIYRVPSPEKGRIHNLYAIYKLLRKERISVIHCHTSYYSGFINFVAFLAGVKIRIVHSHTTNDLRKQSIVRKTYNCFSKILIKLFSNVKIACGEDAGEYLYGSSHYEVIKNGVDLDQYRNVTEQEIREEKKKWNISEEDFIIGHVGRFVELKNQIFFINLAKVLKSYNKKFKIVLVGNGEMFEEIRNKIKAEDLENYFVLPGLSDKIPVHMCMFNVFILPSFYEGFPLVVIEALAGQNRCYLSNTISKETQVIPEMVQFFSLEEKIDCLIEDIINSRIQKLKKEEILKMLTQRGYSIKDTANRMMKIYLD